MERRKEPLMKNMALVGYDDLDGRPAFQMAMQKANGKYYLYTASWRHNGWTVLDVTDPASPRKVRWVQGPWFYEGIRDGQNTCKIQVADGLMITAHGTMASFLTGCAPNLPAWCGMMVWDVKTDPKNPKLLGQFECSGGQGVHRSFYSGGRYAYLTGCCEGYESFILRIMDLKDPKHPREASRWCVPEQVIRGESKTGFGEHLKKPFVHAVTVKDDVAYLAYANVGLVMLDVRDKKNPVFMGKVPLNPPFGRGASGAPVHSAFPLGDRPYVVVSTEGERSRYFDGKKEEGFGKKIVTQAMNMIGIVEITDPGEPNLISVFPYRD